MVFQGVMCDNADRRNICLLHASAAPRDSFGLDKNISLLSNIIQLADTVRVGNVTVSTISIFIVQVRNSRAYTNIAYLSDLHQQSEVQKSIL